MIKSFIEVFKWISLSMLAQSCCMPSAMAPSAFPTSSSETHTRTNVVMPPSYATVSLPPPSISQAAPVIQQPMMMSAPACPPPHQYSSSPCPPAYRSSYDPCASNYQQTYQTGGDPCNPHYTIAVPPPRQPVYTIAIPPAAPPQYQISLPAQQAPTYNIQAPQPIKAPVRSTHCETYTAPADPC